MATRRESLFKIKLRKDEQELPPCDTISRPPLSDLSPIKIFASCEYDSFKILNSNRKLNKLHLKRLEEIISVNNRLHLHPILVNADYEVIDGQHRLSVARKLGVPIYYIKSDIIARKHIIECNANQ